MEESREESMIFDVYFPATVHAASTTTQKILSRDTKNVPSRLVGDFLLLTADQFVSNLSRHLNHDEGD